MSTLPGLNCEEGSNLNRLRGGALQAQAQAEGKVCSDRSFEWHQGSGQSDAPHPHPHFSLREGTATPLLRCWWPCQGQGVDAPWLLGQDPPLCWISNCRCCQKLRKGAMPVPGPIRMQGTWGFRGRWKLGALDKEEKVSRLAGSTVSQNSWVSLASALSG